MKNRKSILLILLACLLLSASLYGYVFMQGQKTNALRTNQNLSKVYHLSGLINRIKNKPRQAYEQETLTDTITGDIEDSISNAGIPPASLIRITPQPAIRIDNSAYKEKPVLIRLKNINLQQLVSFLHGLIEKNNTFNIKNIRLSAPTQDDTSQNWNSEITLTCLLYAPPTK